MPLTAERRPLVTVDTFVPPRPSRFIASRELGLFVVLQGAAATEVALLARTRRSPPPGERGGLQIRIRLRDERPRTRPNLSLRGVERTEHLNTQKANDDDRHNGDECDHDAVLDHCCAFVRAKPDPEVANEASYL